MTQLASGSCQGFGATTPAVRLLLGVVPQIPATHSQSRTLLTAFHPDPDWKS
jgi:hypothetical protein